MPWSEVKNLQVVFGWCVGFCDWLVLSAGGFWLSDPFAETLRDA